MDDKYLVGVDLGTSATKVRFTSLMPLRWLKRVLIYLPIIPNLVLFNRKFLISGCPDSPQES